MRPKAVVPCTGVSIPGQGKDPTQVDSIPPPKIEMDYEAEVQILILILVDVNQWQELMT